VQTPTVRKLHMKRSIKLTCSIHLLNVKPTRCFKARHWVRKLARGSALKMLRLVGNRVILTTFKEIAAKVILAASTHFRQCILDGSCHRRLIVHRTCSRKYHGQYNLYAMQVKINTSNALPALMRLKVAMAVSVWCMRICPIRRESTARREIQFLLTKGTTVTKRSPIDIQPGCSILWEDVSKALTILFSM